MAEQNRDVTVRVNIKAGDQSAAKDLEATAKKADEAAKAVEGLNQALTQTPTAMTVSVTADGVKDAVADIQASANAAMASTNNALKATGQSLRDMLRAVVQDTGNIPNLDAGALVNAAYARPENKGAGGFERAKAEAGQAFLAKTLYDSVTEQGRPRGVETFDQAMALAAMGQAGAMAEFPKAFPGLAAPVAKSEAGETQPAAAPSAPPSPAEAVLQQWMTDPDRQAAMAQAIQQRLQESPIEPPKLEESEPEKLSWQKRLEARVNASRGWVAPKPTEPVPVKVEADPGLHGPTVPTLAQIPDPDDPFQAGPMTAEQEASLRRHRAAMAQRERGMELEAAMTLPPAQSWGTPGKSWVKPSDGVREHMDFYRPFRGEFDASKANKDKVEIKPEPLNDLGRRISALRDATAIDAKHTEAQVRQEETSWVSQTRNGKKGVGQTSEFDDFTLRLMRVQWQAQAGQMAIQGLVGAASPDALRTFTMSLELLSGEIGMSFIPGTIKMSGWLQQAARGWRDMDRGTKENITSVATWATVAVGGAWATAKIGSSLAQAGAAWVTFGGAARSALFSIATPAGAAAASVLGIGAAALVAANHFGLLKDRAKEAADRVRESQREGERLRQGAMSGEDFRAFRERNPVNQAVALQLEATNDPAEQRRILNEELQRLRRQQGGLQGREGLARQIEQTLIGRDLAVVNPADPANTPATQMLQRLRDLGMSEEDLRRAGINSNPLAGGFMPGNVSGLGNMTPQRSREIAESFRSPLVDVQREINAVENMLQFGVPDNATRSQTAGVNAEAAPILEGFRRQVAGMTDAQRASAEITQRTMIGFQANVAMRPGLSPEVRQATLSQAMQLFVSQNQLRVPTNQQMQALGGQRAEPVRLSRQPVYQEQFQVEQIYERQVRQIGMGELEQDQIRLHQQGNAIMERAASDINKMKESLQWMEAEGKQ